MRNMNPDITVSVRAYDTNKSEWWGVEMVFDNEKTGTGHACTIGMLTLDYNLGYYVALVHDKWGEIAHTAVFNSDGRMRAIEYLADSWRMRYGETTGTYDAEGRPLNGGQWKLERV